MTSDVEIRESTPGDLAAIEQIYADAFPDEDLIPLVRELLDLPQIRTSHVALRDNKVVGNVIFTFCEVGEAADKVALLAPLAVAPDFHKQGIGTALVEEGFERLKKSNLSWVFVLGDPAYYSRFGFKAEGKVTTPYPIPAEWSGAWQSVNLCDAPALQESSLSVPEPWQHRALWSS